MPEEKNKKLDYDEIQKLIETEIKQAEENTEVTSSNRQDSWDRYYGRKLGNEVKGRSKFITREVMDTIEWMMPYFIKTFASGDPKVDIEIKGQGPWIGKALMDNIQLELGNSTPNLFILFYQWFKDALISDTAFIEASWFLDREDVKVEFDNLSADNMQQLVVDRDVKIISEGNMNYIPDAGIVFTGVTANVRKTIADRIHADSVPHWEFIAHPKARDVNDEYGKGHKTEVTLDYLKRINRAMSKDGKAYFRDLEDLESEDGKGAETGSINESEKSRYMGSEDLVATTTSEKGAKAPIKFIQWYTRLDVDGDGYLENIVCCMANDRLIRWELNKEDMIPFSAIKPIIDCYKFRGISYAELVVEIQNLKTMLFRRILDNFDFQNTGRWMGDPNASIDVNALLKNRPGSFISGKPEGLKDITPKPFQPQALTILEYVDTVKRGRTGLYNPGVSAGDLSKTATGIRKDQTEVMQRLGLIGRIFAETGLKDFYTKCAMLYQKYMTQPFIAKVQGEERQVTPDMIKGKVVCRVNLGIEAALGAQEAEKIERMLGVLLKLNEAYPGLLTPENVYNICSKYITAFGWKQVDDFISELQEFTTGLKEKQEHKQKVQQMMMQLQQQEREREMGLKGKELEVKAGDLKQKAELAMAELVQEGKIAQSELAQEAEIERQKIAQKDRQVRGELDLGYLKALQGKRSA